MTLCQQVRSGVHTRLFEARELLNAINGEEAERTSLSLPSTYSTTLRGLTYISIYGAIEYAVIQGTQAFINYLCGLSVNTKHLEHALYSVALDSQLSSARDASPKKKWETRRKIFSALESRSICNIPDNVFGTFLHNVYPQTIEEIFSCLGINKDPTFSGRDIGYFKEITEQRNAVAHGREAASDVGKGLTSNDIQNRIDATYRICSYFLDVLDEHATELRFVRSRYRAAYRVRAEA